MTTIGQFSINNVNNEYVIVHKNKVIHTESDYDAAIKITQVFNKIYKSGKDDGGERLRKLFNLKFYLICSNFIL